MIYNIQQNGNVTVMSGRLRRKTVCSEKTNETNENGFIFTVGE